MREYGALMGDVRAMAATGTRLWMDPSRVKGRAVWGGWVVRAGGARECGGLKECVRVPDRPAGSAPPYAYAASLECFAIMYNTLLPSPPCPR